MSIFPHGRRATLAGAVSLVLLSACGTDASSEDDDSGGDAGGAFPVTVEHTYGETEIPEQPHRVVSLG